MVCACLLVMVFSSGVVAEGPPPCEPPAGYVPPEVDARIVGLMADQRVAVGSTHDLTALALDTEGLAWGERYDWYVDGEHVATGPEFSWTVVGPPGKRRVTMVASSGDAAVWTPVDVSVGTVPTDPPDWLGPSLRVVPLVAVALWLAMVYRQMARRRGDGSG